MNENDITKPSGYNPGISVPNPAVVRFVKVKTVGDLAFSDVEKIILENSMNGWEPIWEEIVEEDTPALDTVKVFSSGLHQSTIPIPLDIFPMCTGMSLDSIITYTERICKREGWKPTYINRMIVLNQLAMELG